MCNISIGFRSGMIMCDYYTFGRRCLGIADSDHFIYTDGRHLSNVWSHLKGLDVATRFISTH